MFDQFCWYAIYPHTFVILQFTHYLPHLRRQYIAIAVIEPVEVQLIPIPEVSLIVSILAQYFGHPFITSSFCVSVSPASFFITLIFG